MITNSFNVEEDSQELIAHVIQIDDDHRNQRFVQIAMMNIGLRNTEGLKEVSSARERQIESNTPSVSDERFPILLGFQPLK